MTEPKPPIFEGSEYGEIVSARDFRNKVRAEPISEAEMTIEEKRFFRDFRKMFGGEIVPKITVEIVEGVKLSDFANRVPIGAHVAWDRFRRRVRGLARERCWEALAADLIGLSILGWASFYAPEFLPQWVLWVVVFGVYGVPALGMVAAIAIDLYSEARELFSEKHNRPDSTGL